MLSMGAFLFPHYLVMSLWLAENLVSLSVVRNHYACHMNGFIA
jgi:hypothetical protein